MCRSFTAGDRITLWCELSASASDPDCETPPQKKRAPTPRERTEEELDEVFQQLQDKHPGMGSTISFWILVAISFIHGFVMYSVCTMCYVVLTQHACL